MVPERGELGSGPTLSASGEHDVTRLAAMPGIGRAARFSVPVLRDLPLYPVERPFERHLIFYHHDSATLYVERAVHGARDLPRRLTQPPDVEDP